MRIYQYDYCVLWYGNNGNRQHGPTAFFCNTEETFEELRQWLGNDGEIDGGFVRRFPEPEVASYFLGDYSDTFIMPVFAIVGEVVQGTNPDGNPRGVFRSILMDSARTVLRVMPDGVSVMPPEYILEIIASMDVFSEWHIVQRNFLQSMAEIRGYSREEYQTLRRNFYTDSIVAVLKPTVSRRL